MFKMTHNFEDLEFKSFYIKNNHIQVFLSSYIDCSRIICLPCHGKNFMRVIILHKYDFVLEETHI